MIGERIKSARDAAQLSQYQLAQAIGVTPNTIWRYEHGEMRPRGDVIVRLAEKLGRPVEWFYQGSGDPEAA